MALSTYAELKSAVASVAVRTDQTAMIPMYVAQAEAMMAAGDPAREIEPLRVNAMISTAALSLTTAGTVNLPADYLGPVSLLLDVQDRELDAVTLRTLNTLRTDRDSTAAEPRAYALTGTQFKFSPIPDQTYAATLTYFAKIAALTTDGSTNWVLTNYPSVYLYGALMFMAPVIQEDERVALWQSLYVQALSQLVAAEQAKDGPLTTPLFVASDVPRRRGRFNILTGG